MKTQLTLPGIYPTTYHLHFLGLCLVFITACSVLKEKSFYETDSLLRQDSRRVLHRESEVQGESIRIVTTADSAGRQTMAEIFPKGTFRYSPAEGFSGEAERLLLSERFKAGRRQTESTRIRRSRQEQTALKDGTSLRQTSRTKERQQQPATLTGLYLAGCGLIFLLIYLLRRFFRD